jgi:hypothetical protein
VQLPLYILPIASVSLEVLLIWRLWRCRLLGVYPYFGAFVIYDLGRSAVLFPLSLLWSNVYAWTYWTTEVISVFLRLFVVWEAIRTVFLPGSNLRRLAWKFLLAVGSLILPAIAALWWRQSLLVHFPNRFVPPIFEQYFSLIQAILLLIVAVLGRYYGISLGRNMRGLIFGFGLYLTLCALNFASFQFIRGFLPYWQFVSPVSYVGLIAFWLWSFWQRDPVSQALTPHDCIDFEDWNQKSRRRALFS